MAVLFLAAGCASVGEVWDDWFGTSARREVPAPLLEFTPSVRVAVRAKAQIGSAGNAVFVPGFTQDAVFAAAADGRLARFELATGRELWQVKLKQRLSAGVGVGPKLVVVAGPKGEVFAYDHDGKLVWQTRVSSEVLAVPVVTQDSVYVRSLDGRIHALDAATGQRRWFYQRAIPALTVRNTAGLLVDRNGVFAGFGGGKLVALEAGTGTVAWEATVAQPRGVSELERIADVTSNPVTDGQLICAAAFQGRVACFDINTGAPVWGRELSSFTGVALDARNLYVTEARGALHAFDKGSGASVWKQDKLALRQLSGPALYRGYVVVGDLQGQVHFLSREDGAFAARIATDGSPIRATPQVTPQGVLVQTLKGGLYLLGLD
ncbi:outer membrane protein assembly factor BamB [Thiobacter aerophilum]|uniref:outer membrane protein assembly factor BamB n=1 Tax=Thiobacter aerophilum TaxID=3121275 RepID=UPI003D2FD367